MNSKTKIYQIPKFTGEHIPVKEAARIMGKNIEYVRIGIIEGFLPIGTAFKKKAQVSILITSVQESSGSTQAMCTKGRIKRRRYHYLQIKQLNKNWSRKV